ncbi:hypothetical protein [Pseudoduganella sp. HUAS MS19]
MNRALHRRIFVTLCIATTIAFPCLFFVPSPARPFLVSIVGFTVGYSGLMAAILGVGLGTIDGGRYKPVHRGKDPIKFWLMFLVFIFLGLTATIFAFFSIWMGIARLG